MTERTLGQCRAAPRDEPLRGAASALLVKLREYASLVAPRKQHEGCGRPTFSPVVEAAIAEVESALAALSPAPPASPQQIANQLLAIVADEGCHCSDEESEEAEGCSGKCCMARVEAFAKSLLAGAPVYQGWVCSECAGKREGKPCTTACVGALAANGEDFTARDWADILEALRCAPTGGGRGLTHWREKWEALAARVEVRAAQQGAATP